MSEIPDIPSPSGGEDSWLNTGVSIAVALAGTFMALTNVKDGNICQAMADAQTRKVDAWNYYQAKSTKQHVAEGTLEQLESLKLLMAAANPAVGEELDRKIATFRARAEKYEAEKAKIKEEAEGWEKAYDDLNKRDDQFDLSDATMSVGIALCGVAALVKRRSLFGVALVFLGFGALMGLAGFLEWQIQIPFLSKLLS